MSRKWQRVQVRVHVSSGIQIHDAMKTPTLALLGATACFSVIPFSAPATAQDLECSFASAVLPAHLDPGESREVVIQVELTILPAEGALELAPYEWSPATSQLVTVAPGRGDLRVHRALPADAGRYLGHVELTVTAGSRAGSEVLAIGVLSTDPNTPRNCRRFEIAVPVMVGGDWSITAEKALPGSMSVIGHIVGSFSVVDGQRVQGDGVTRATVTSTCTHGVSQGPIKITGTVEGELMRVVVAEDWEAEPTEPNVQMDESMECVIVTLREMPSALRALAEWAAEGLGQRACPIEVPLESAMTPVRCGGLDFVVVRR